MVTLSDRLSQFRDTLSGRLASSQNSGLTKRELEVLGLVSRGMTNQEIAYSLFISEYTVGNHVSNILTKTSTTNRTEAALYAAKKGLLD